MIERERVRQIRLHALEALSRQRKHAGRFADAIDLALAAIAIEPLQESAHLALIEAHVAEGNLAGAVRQYNEYSELLDRELGLSPTFDVSGPAVVSQGADAPELNSVHRLPMHDVVHTSSATTD